MNESRFDLIARQIARTETRRGVIRLLAGIVSGGIAANVAHEARAATQPECNFGWETYCTQLIGADQCVDFSTDSSHCGVCNNACPDLTVCVEGRCNGSINGQPPGGVISASVQCVDGPSKWPRDELLEVTISNDTTQPVTVAHIASLLGPAQPSYPGFVVDPGEAWSGLVPRTFPDGEAVQGGVVTTNAGALVLPCGYTNIPFTTEELNLDDPEETAAIMTRVLSVLESTYIAFDALYTLLHPDARELVSYQQLTCWYREYVRTERPAGEATVSEVRLGPWTWPGNGKRYEDAAEVTYRQPFYANEGGGDMPPPTEDREGTIHLVQADGLWRWFFGTDPKWLAALPETC